MKYSGYETREDAYYITHQGVEHRWKQSGIRGDIRLVTHKEGQGGELLFKIKQEVHMTKKPKTGHPSPRCDIWCRKNR